MTGITYDTGALIAAERNDRRMWALHAAFLAEEVVPTVPAPVLAEAWRGGSRQASLARLLTMCEIEDLTEARSRAVGVLAGRSHHDDIVEVAVVEGAARRGDAIITSNRSHMELVAGATRRKVRIEDV